MPRDAPQLPLVSVFVSSTWLDLEPERAAVETTLQRFRETKFVGMEHFGSRDESTSVASTDEVDRSDLYIGIFGERYGSGITEAEYRRAQSSGIPCLIYFKKPATKTANDGEADALNKVRLERLKKEIWATRLVREFALPDELAAWVAADLHRWLFDEYLIPLLEDAARGRGPRSEAQAFLQAIREPGTLGADLLNRLRSERFLFGGATDRVAAADRPAISLFFGNYERLRDAYLGN